jgi:hypothetical protein
MCERSVGPSTTYRHVRTGRDLDSRHRTVILWQAADLVKGQVEAHIIIILEATLDTVVILSVQQVLTLADTVRTAAGIP